MNGSGLTSSYLYIVKARGITIPD